jgi:hypothetical protein
MSAVGGGLTGGGAAALGAARARPSGGDGGDADSALVLIADDVPANVELLADQLQLLGYRRSPPTTGRAPSRWRSSGARTSACST